MRPSILLGIGLVFLTIGLCPGWLLQQDASARLVIARELWKNNTVFIERARPERYVRTPNGYTTYFGIGQTLLFIPFDYLGYQLGKLPGAAKWWDNHIQVLPLLLLYLPLLSILWWNALRFLLHQLGLSEKESLKWSTLYFIFSAMLVYSAQSFQEEPILGILSAFALGLCLRWQKNGSRTCALRVGLLGA